MKKCVVCIIGVLMAFTTYVYNYVYASEEDILYIPIEEDAEIENDLNLLKSLGNISNTRSVVSDPALARTIKLGRLVTTWRYISCPVVNIPDSTKYRVYVKSKRADDNYFDDLVGAIGYPKDVGYFVRGQEQNNMPFTWFINGEEENGQLQLDSNYNSGTNYNGDWLEYIEPTPEPTPDPTPEIDPETLSGNELLREILITNKEINDNVKGINQYLSNNYVSDSVLSDNSISDNIIDKPLSEYDLKESLLLFIVLLGISAGLVYIIHKSIYKWG